MNNRTYKPIVAITRLLIGLSLATTVILIASYAVRADPGVLYAAPTAQGSGDCSSWANACTLQTALTTAVSGNEIWVQVGVHYAGVNREDTFTLKSGVAIYGGFAGTETARDQRDWQANPTILSGDIDQNDINTDGNYIAETWNDIQGYNSYHVVRGGNDVSAVLDGFVVTAGHAGSPHWPDNIGGGVYNWLESPTLTNVIISGNFASVNGGGMYNYANSNPVLTNVIFTGNHSDGYGGGIHNEYNSSPTLLGVTFLGNSAGSAGGGMLNDEASAVLTNVVFSGNSAGSEGGGMRNLTSSLVLTNVTFSGNSAGSEGGGMCNFNSNITLDNAVLWGNSAANGPEIYNDATTPTISYSEIQGCGGSGAGWQSACGTDNGGNIDANPLFVNAAGGDLRLGFGSPAIDAGTNTGCPSTDLDGLPRPGDGDASGTATCDMGAYEAGEMICGAAQGSDYTFVNNSSVVIHPTSSGSLACLYVDEMGGDHPQATSGLKTDRYWLIRGLQSDKQTDATGFTINLTLPIRFTPDANDKVCRYTGSGQVWDCAMSSYTTYSITRNDVTMLSDWAVGNDVGPTAVTLVQLTAHAVQPHPVWLVIGLVLLAGVGLFIRQATRVKVKQHHSACGH